MPLFMNHSFPPSITDSVFLMWRDKQLRYFRDLYKDGTFCSFAVLSTEFELPSSHLFRYFQARHGSASLLPNFPCLPPKLAWEDFLDINSFQKSLISRIYCQLIELEDCTIIKAKSAWEHELGEEFADDWWTIALNRIYTSSICARLALIQFKILHRVHYSKVRLSAIYSNVDDSCDRCHVTL